MSSKTRQTFGKRDRERARLEKRARKQEKKDERKLAAHAPENVDGSPDAPSAAERQPPAL